MHASDSRECQLVLQSLSAGLTQSDRVAIADSLQPFSQLSATGLRAAFVEQLKQRTGAEDIQILCPWMQIIGEFCTVGNVGSEFPVQSPQAACMKLR